MTANVEYTLANLKQIITQLSVGDRWALLKWLIELLQQDPQSSQLTPTNVNFEVVQQICEEIRYLPVLDNRPPDDIIGYNQFGGLD
ncbi:MAG: hypothetical protein AAGD09_09545 [Cyanobacteria bacterium P01_F01_bin.56]